MNFIDDARVVARRAWSMRFIYASVLVGAADAALPYFAPEHASPAFGVLSMVLGVAAGVSRLIDQPTMRGE